MHQEWDYDGIYRKRRHRSRWADDGEVIDVEPIGREVYLPARKPKRTLFRAYLRQMRSPKNSLLTKAVMTGLFGAWAILIYGAIFCAVGFITITIMATIRG